jgi:hypothetical protein
MSDPLELRQQVEIERLAPGDTWDAGRWFVVFRYKDGWHFYWKFLAFKCQDLGRFFDENHIWEMRNFMSGQWGKGVIILPPNPEELI